MGGCLEQYKEGPLQARRPERSPGGRDITDDKVGEQERGVRPPLPRDPLQVHGGPRDWRRVQDRKLQAGPLALHGPARMPENEIRN